MNHLNEQTSEFLSSLQMGKSIDSGTNSDDAGCFIVSLVGRDGLIERSRWPNFGPSIRQINGCDSLISRIIQKLKDERGVIEYSSFVGIDGETKRIVVEYIKERLKLIVFGAGHVGGAVARLGVLVGYKVIIVDDRSEILSGEDLSSIGVQVRQVNFGDELSCLDISADTAAVIVTRGHQYDEACLRFVLNSPAFYIGMIGSKKRVLSIFRKLELEGFSVEKLKSVFAPIGLRIGAVSPQEIAVSIVAEIISCVKRESLEGKCHLKV